MKQMSIFEALYERYKITKPIRLIELFGGIGSQAKALENLHANFEHYKLVEFDKYPVASYNAIHGTNFVPMDITKIHSTDLEIVDRDKYEYIMTYSFPCQDLSLAGKGRGMSKGSGTRSGLLWEVERLLTECTELPQVLLMENVPQVIGEKNIEDFRAWELFLENKGYSNYHQILNAKDYGIPQNRQRCFMISILGDAYYEFPEAIPLKLKLKDMLEDEVDEKYYLSKKMLEYIVADNEKWTGNNNKAVINKTIASTINTCEGSRRCDASNFISDDVEENFSNSVLDANGITPTLDTMMGGNRQPKILVKNKALTETLEKNKVDASNNTFIAIKNATKKGYLEATEGDGVDISTRMESHRGTVQKDMIQTIKAQLDVGVVVAAAVDSNGLAPTVMENYGTVTATNVGLRIRKLTPKECWRLMGFSDEDFDRASKVNSNAQLYKQAGNSIVVNVLMAIFNQLL